MLKFIALSSLVLHICTALVHSGDGILFPPPLIKVEGELLGHLKRYGMQSAPSAPVKEYDQPLPTQEFWENHVKPHIPLVLRQAINKSPAIKLWTDKYLTDTYGDLDVLVELKKENRTSSSGRMRLKDFLKLYEREEIYVVSMLPSEMMPEIQAIPSVLCGTFKNYTHESNLWISNGGTRSVIHYDADHNLHCMIAGRKDFMMVENKYSEELYFGPKPRGVGSAFSALDPDVVDMNLHPNHAKVPWTWATLHAGDCIFIPSIYIHQVRAYGRSVAATTLFTADVHNNFTSDDCNPDIMKTYHNMSEIDFRWTYKKGDETIDMGFMNDELTRERFRETLHDEDKFKHNNGRIYWKHFIRLGFNFPHLRMVRNYTQVEQIFKRLTGEKDYIDLEMVENYTREEMKAVVRIIENPHGIVTDGKVEVLARPGERAKYEDGPIQYSEVEKFLNAAVITERQRKKYIGLVRQEENGDEDDEEEQRRREQGGEQDEEQDGGEQDDGQEGDEDEGARPDDVSDDDAQEREPTGEDYADENKQTRDEL